MPVAAIAAGVLGAGAVGSAVIGKSASDKAAKAQKKALKKVQRIDIDEYKRQAKLGDEESYVNQLEALRRADPDLYAARQSAVSQFKAAAEARPEERVAGLDAALLREATAASQQTAPEAILEAALRERAQQKLDLGATLPPEYQAELIRAGLESAGTTGIGADRRGPLAQLLGREIGSRALALEAAREQQAAELAAAANTARATRLGILTGTADTLIGRNAGQLSRAGGILSGLQAMSPGGGMTGADVIQALEANRNTQNQMAMTQGQLKAQQALATGNMWSGIFGGVTQAGAAGLLAGLGAPKTPTVAGGAPPPQTAFRQSLSPYAGMSYAAPVSSLGAGLGMSYGR